MILRNTDVMGWNFPHGTPHPRSAYGRIGRLGRLGRLGQDWGSWGEVDWTDPGLDGDFSVGYANTGVDLPSSYYGLENWSQIPGDVGTPSTSGSGSGSWDSAIDSIMKLAQAGLVWDAQRRMVDLNIERAKQGLAPIDASRISPQVGVKVGLQPQTQQMLMIGAIALGAVVLLSGRGRGRK